MTSKLIPPNPDKVMVIRNITPDVVTLSLPFSRFGHINIGGRGTLGTFSQAHCHTLELTRLSTPAKWQRSRLLPRSSHRRSP